MQIPKNTFVFSSFKTLLFIWLFGCTSPQKHFDRGAYDKAFYSAINDLKKNPDNAKAQALLPEAFNQYVGAINDQLADQRNHNAGPEALYNSYSELQRIYEAVRSTPAAQKIITTRNYSSELAEAANNAAAYYYDKGEALMAAGDRKSAQEAYTNFQKASSFSKNYREVNSRLKEAEDIAFVNVVVNTIDQRFGYYSVDGNFLRADIMRQLNYAGRNNFYRFLDQYGAGNTRADQFMDIALYDLWIGQLFASNYSYDVSKSIEVPVENEPRKKTTITVNAKVNVTRRVIESRAMMDTRITDAATRRLMYTERFPAQYSWEKLTGSYSGDSRALSDKDWAIVRGVYNNPPSTDELYRELTRVIMNDFTNRMRQIYSR